MAGVIPADARMHARPQGRGYAILEADPARHPWPGAAHDGKPVHAHEFHYSSLDGLPDDCRFAWRVERGHGIANKRDGLVYRNLLASYCHLRNTAASPWVEQFLDFVASRRQAAPRAIRAV